MPNKKSPQKTVVPSLGDIVQIPLSSGYAYAQYVNHHRKSPCYGELIRILPETFEVALSGDDVIRHSKKAECFYCFTPLALFVRRRMVQILGRAPIPQRCRKMPHFKAFNLNPDTGRKTWFIWDGTSAKAQRVETLSEEERKYPLEEIVSFESLVRRIETGWLPEHEPE